MLVVGLFFNKELFLVERDNRLVFICGLVRIDKNLQYYE